MKKFLVAAVLAFAATAFAQMDAAQPQAADQQPQGAAQQKTIKDPTEYNAYITATGLADPTQKAAALEQFVQQYPNSVVKEEALAAAMAAYQQAGNLQKSADVAARVLQSNPNNVPAIAVSVYTKRQQAVNTTNPALFNEAGVLGARSVNAIQ